MTNGVSGFGYSNRTADYIPSGYINPYDQRMLRGLDDNNRKYQLSDYPSPYPTVDSTSGTSLSNPSGGLYPPVRSYQQLFEENEALKADLRRNLDTNLKLTQALESLNRRLDILEKSNIDLKRQLDAKSTTPSPLTPTSPTPVAPTVPPAKPPDGTSSTSATPTPVETPAPTPQPQPGVTPVPTTNINTSQPTAALVRPVLGNYSHFTNGKGVATTEACWSDDPVGNTGVVVSNTVVGAVNVVGNGVAMIVGRGWLWD
ncbi:MAG: hypothetical protein K2X66_19180 [Cyanobacteria bacterium]|nr:hypothetical protein [Cyanobacteriota bacterium]